MVNVVVRSNRPDYGL